MQIDGPEEHELVEQEAELLAADHAVDVGRVKEILESLLDAGWRGAGISYSPLHEAVERVGFSDALRIFEEEDLETLRSRVLIAHYVANPFTPVYSLDRLGELFSALLEYLDRNRARLQQTGHPQSNFRRSPYLDWHLTRLYFTKLPFRVQEGRTVYEQGSAELQGDAAVDQHGDFIYKYEWEKPTSEEMSFTPTGTYGEAEVIGGLSPADAGRLDALRPRLLELREAVVGRLQEGLHRRSSRRLFSDCIRILSDDLSHEEACFLVDRDRFYDELSDGKLAPWSPDMRVYVFHSGGLSDLLSVVARCEWELEVGAMEAAVQSLPTVRDEEWDAPCWYYKAVIMPERDRIDGILDGLNAVQAEAETFREMHRTRVRDALEEFRHDVTVTVSVKAKHLDTYEPVLTSLAEYVRAQQEATGKVPSLMEQVGGARTPQAPKNVFRMRGDTWEVGLAGEDPVLLNHTKGMSYIAYLLDHPEAEFTALDLFRRVGQSWTPDSAERQAAAMDSPGITAGVSSPDPVADRKSLANLDRELEEAQADLLRAQRRGDAAGAAEALKRIRKLEGVGTKTVGKGGRSRSFRGDNERARTAISKAIHRALKRISEKHSGMHRHLTNSLQVGRTLSYKRSPPVDWQR